MKNNTQIGTLGEKELIKLIEELVLKKTGKKLLRDDSVFFDIQEDTTSRHIVLNSDMLVSTTDVPRLMNSHQIGRKAVIMNVSDLLVKGVIPKGVIISFGLPRDLIREKFMDIVKGIIDCSAQFNMDYIGGDINETHELIINPTVFGFKNPSTIIYRKGAKVGDVLVANNKFGLTGVGFDILLNKNRDPKHFPKYQRSIKSVLEPSISGREALILSDSNLATASIDSSDGLYKSLQDLMLSNPNLGFEITFNKALIASEAFEFCEEFNVSLEELVFNGGEEFIHLFTIDPRDLLKAQKEIQSKSAQIFKIGKVTSEKNISILKEGEKKEIKNYGFEHFGKKA
jgi:thiamine-monophosphate kinase